MILHRVVFQAQPGKANELVAAIKQGYDILPEEQFAALQPRVLTDISGPFDTVILESTHESLAAYEILRTALWAAAEQREEASHMQSLIVSGRNEYYTIEM